MAFVRRSTRGFTFCTTALVVGVIAILLLLMFQGAALVRERAELVRVTAQVSQLSDALHLYCVTHRQFPDSYPAHLEWDLRPYVSRTDLFINRAWPEAGAAALNRSYVAPIVPGDCRYVLSLDPACRGSQCVVLYGDSTVETVDNLPICRDGQSVDSTSQVTGGLIRFTSGAGVSLPEAAVASLARSFRANDGSLFHIIKFDSLPAGLIATAVPPDAIVELASSPALVLIRGGTAGSSFQTADGQPRIQVLCRTGEVIVDGRLIGGPTSSSQGLNVDGQISISPSNGSDFEFSLEKPDGSTITRNDLLAAGSSFDYNGPASKLTFAGQSQSGQTGLILNGQPFPLDGGQAYTITASDMTVHLHNDKSSGHGKAMGQWRLDDLHATDAHVFTGSGETPVAAAQAASASGTLLFDDRYRTDSGRNVRTLGRGILVKPGEQVTAAKYR